MGQHVAETGRVPLEVFMALWKNTVMGGVDLSVTRSGSKPEILLVQRPEGDPFAGLWHIPGTRVLLGDDAISAITKRVAKQDFGWTVMPHRPDFLLTLDIMKGPELTRDTSPIGQEFYRAYLLELKKGDPEIRERDTICFFPLDEIPDEFLLYQLPTIDKLRAKYGV